MKKLCGTMAIALLVLLFLLCGCSGRQSAEPSVTIPSQAVKPGIATDNASFYFEVLHDYETIVRFRLSDTFEDNWNNDCFPSISTMLTLAIQENSSVEWSNMIVEMTAGLNKPTASSFGYILKDINGDDSPELFWVRDDYTIIAIFTNKNGKLVLLDAFWPKHECVITNKGELYCRTSGGALYIDFTTKVLTTQGVLMHSKQFGIEGYSVATKELYYEIANDEKYTISKNRFDELLEENPFEFSSDWLSQEIRLLG